MYLSKGERFRILVMGKDARSDAIVAGCSSSSLDHALFACCEYNNPGFLRKCKDLHVSSITDVGEIVRYANEIRPNLAIIGPEEPLEVGMVDALEEIGIPCFGPYKDLARIETSKAWTRELLKKYGIAGNPEYRIFRSTADLRGYLNELGDFVVKPDGLTGGKGVRVSGEHLSSENEAVTYVRELLERHDCVVIEEKLEGEEFSLQTITDGETMIHCPIAQDHKRAFEGDTGPNTGGMGSYSYADFTLPFIRQSDVDEAKAMNTAVIHAMGEETGRPYRGVLYGGFMATRHGTRLVEYNARFADPEAMNILPLIQGDFIELCYAVATGNLRDNRVTFAPKATVCKYVVPRGYPDCPEKDEVIDLPECSADGSDVQTFFAGVKQEGGQLYLTGSRAIAFVGIADTLEKAEKLAENAACSVRGPVRHRSDIGTRALVDMRIDHMDQLRPILAVAK